MKRLLLILALSAQCFGAAFTASVTGDWSNTATWGGSGPPGNGDTITINTGVTVTVSDARIVGTDGASGTVVAVVNGTGVLTIANGGTLSLRGELDMQQGTTLNINGGGTLQFDPVVGSTYKILGLGTGAGTWTINMVGSAGNVATFTTTARGGGNGSIDGFTNSVGPLLNLSYAVISNCGSTGTTSCIKTNGNANHSFTSAHTLFKNHGEVNLTDSSGTWTFTMDTTDFRPMASTTYSFKVTDSTAKSGGSRLITNTTVYPASGRDTMALWATDLQIGVETAGVCTTPGLIVYNIALDHSVNGARQVNNCSFFLEDGLASGGVAVTPFGKATQVFDSNVVWTHYPNPHIYGESGNGALTANVYSNGICDGDAYYSTDAGDHVLPVQAATITKNLAINNCGTLFTALNAAAVITSTNNTEYFNFGGTIGETTGAATQIAVHRNNLHVNPSTNQFRDGVHQGGNAIRQSAMSLDYNFYCAMPGSGDSNCGTAQAAVSPAVLGNATTGTATSYMAFPATANTASTTATASTSSTSLHCSTCNFTGQAVPVIVGDWVLCTAGCTAANTYAQVTTVNSATVLTLAGSGIAGLVSGSTFQVRINYTATAGDLYGTTANIGTHDQHVSPYFHDTTCTLGKWSNLIAGSADATIATAAAATVALNGYDSTGAGTTFDGKHTVSSALNWMRSCFMPQNATLRAAGSPTDGSPDIGAVAVGSIRHRSQ